MDNLVKIRLQYSGDDVDDGSMAIEDMIPILQGFTGVYSRVVGHKNFKSKHVLRLQGIEQGSCDLVVLAKQILEVTAAMSPLLAVKYNEIVDALKTIKGLVELTPFTMGQGYKITAGPNYGTQTIVNIENASLVVPKDAVALFEETSIKKALSCLAKPLEEGKIDSGKMIVHGSEGESIEAEIRCEDKKYFEIENKEVVTSKEAWIEGTINMMRKSTGRGELILSDGKKVPFVLKMEEPGEYFSFFDFKGAVKMLGVVYFDEMLAPLRIEALDIQQVQRGLFGDDK